MTKLTEVHTIDCEAAQEFIYNATSGMAVVDQNWVFQWVNPAYCKILNAPAGLIVGTNCRSWTHPDDIEQDEELAEQVKEGKSFGYQYSKRYIQRGSTKQNERVIWGLLSATGKFDQNKNLIGYQLQFQPYETKNSLELNLSQLTKIFQWIKANLWAVTIALAIASGLILGNWEPLYKLLNRANSVQESIDSPSELP